MLSPGHYLSMRVAMVATCASVQVLAMGSIIARKWERKWEWPAVTVTQRSYIHVGTVRYSTYGTYSRLRTVRTNSAMRVAMVATCASVQVLAMGSIIARKWERKWEWPAVTVTQRSYIHVGTVRYSTYGTYSRLRTVRTNSARSSQLIS